MRGREISPFILFTMELDFTILYNNNKCCLNAKNIVFSDVSVYNNAPISPKLHIKFPDFEKEYSTSIQYGAINILTTERLGFSDCAIEFPDGVYTFTFEVNNKKCILKKKVYITTQAQIKLVNFINSLQLSDYNNKETLERINKINLYLHAAESGVCENQQQAEALYKQAENLLKCVDVVKTK